MATANKRTEDPNGIIAAICKNRTRIRTRKAREKEEEAFRERRGKRQWIKKKKICYESTETELQLIILGAGMVKEDG